jgi:hypothetical protein
MQPEFRFTLANQPLAVYPTEHYTHNFELDPEAYAEWILHWRTLLSSSRNSVINSYYMDEEGDQNLIHGDLDQLIATACRAALIAERRLADDQLSSYNLTLQLRDSHARRVDADGVILDLLSAPSPRAIIYEAMTEELV